MAGEGPFLWLNERAPDAGFRKLPEGGLCLRAFLFVKRGPTVLLGKYADDPRWEHLTGLDAERRRRHGQGWTLPASHLRYGEDPRAAARRVASEVLQLRGLRFGEPRVETEFAESARPSRQDGITTCGSSWTRKARPRAWRSRLGSRPSNGTTRARYRRARGPARTRTPWPAGCARCGRCCARPG